MNRIIRIACALTLVILTLASLPAIAAEKVSLAAVAPEDTFFFVEARDLTALQADWENTPFYKIWTDSKFDAFLKPAKTALPELIKKSETEEDFNLEELKKLFPGSVAMVARGWEMIASKKGIWNSEGYMANFQGDPKRVRELMERVMMPKDLSPDTERSTTNYRDAKIYTMLYREAEWVDEDGNSYDDEEAEMMGKESLKKTYSEVRLCFEFAYVDDLFIVTKSLKPSLKEYLVNYFAAKESKPRACLATAANYKQAVSTLERTPDAHVFVNLESAQRDSLEAISKLAGPAGTSSLPLIVDKYDLIVRDILGFDKARSAMLSARAVSDGMEMDFGLRFTSGVQGLSGVLLAEGRNAFRSQKMTPATAYAYYSTLFDANGVYEWVKSFASSMDENGEQTLKMGLEQIHAMTGVRLEEDVIQKLGSEFGYFVNKPSTTLGTPSMSDRAVIMMELKNEQGFAKTMETLITTGLKSAPNIPLKIETSKFQGIDIYSLKPDQNNPAAAEMFPSEMPEACFAVAGGFFILGAPSEDVKEVLSLQKNGGDTIMQNPRFRKASSQLEKGYSSLAWADLSAFVDETITAVQPMVAPALATLGVVNVGAMPKPEEFARFFGQSVSTSRVANNSFRWNGKWLYPKTVQ